jgi:hypothetical protein
MTTWDQPQDINPINAAFPANVTGTLLPPKEEIPEEFFARDNKWASFVSTMFLRGWDGKDPVLLIKEDVDAQKAFDHVRVVLISFEPKHENKIAGAAYLLSLWFADVVPASEIEYEEPTA